MRRLLAACCAALLLTGCSQIEETVTGAVSSVAADTAGAAVNAALGPVCAAVLVPLNAYEDLAKSAAEDKDVRLLRSLLSQYLRPMAAALETARTTVDSVSSTVETSATAELLGSLGLVQAATDQAGALSDAADAQSVMSADEELRDAVGALSRTCTAL